MDFCLRIMFIVVMTWHVFFSVHVSVEYKWQLNVC